MKGSIRERNGALQLRVSLGRDLKTGKYDYHTETVDASGLNKKQAQDKADKRLRQLLTDIDKGIFIKPGKSSLGEYLDAWLTDYVSPNLAGNTYALYKTMCKKHIIPIIGPCTLADLRPQHIQHLYAVKQKSGLSNRTVQIIHVTLHKALSNAVKTGLISRNVADLVEKPKNKRHEFKVMGESDIHLFLELARDSEYYSLFYLLLFTGMRRNEALALRWADVDMLLCQINISRSLEHLRESKQVNFKEPKTSTSRRSIALTPSTVAVLQEHYTKQEETRRALMSKEELDGLAKENKPIIKDEDLVFSHWNGSPLLPNTVTNAWRKLIKRSGLSGIRLHDARHSHASLMLKQGVSPKIISERLGHSSVSFTMDTYTHSLPNMQKDAAIKFDDIVIKNKN